MPRRLAAQVPQQVSRLLKGEAFPAPVWYQAYLEHPPLTTPPRQLAKFPQPRQTSDREPVTRTGAIVTPETTYILDRKDLARKAAALRTPKLKIPELRFPEDEIRKQFFQDFPFEALRPVTLVEGREIRENRGINGSEWVALKQRGDTPTVEDTIAFVLNLHTHHNLSMSQAYDVATREFIKLRAVGEIANFAAEEELLAYGESEKSLPSRKAFDRFFDLESRAVAQNFPGGDKQVVVQQVRAPRPARQGGPKYRVPRLLFGPRLYKRRTWSPVVPPMATSHGRAMQAAQTKIDPLVGVDPFAEDQDKPSSSATGYTGGVDYVKQWTQRAEAIKLKKRQKFDARMARKQPRELETEQNVLDTTSPQAEARP